MEAGKPLDESVLVKREHLEALDLLSKNLISVMEAIDTLVVESARIISAYEDKSKKWREDYETRHK